MPSAVINWVFVLFFFAALIATAAFRNVIAAVDRRSYRHIAGGITLLAVASVIRIFQSIGLLSGLAVVSDPFFYQLINAIVLLTGVTLVVSGASTWLVARQRSRIETAPRICRLEAIKRVEQLAQLENRIDTILTATLELIVRDFGFQSGAVLKLSLRTGATRVVSSSGVTGPHTAVLSKARFNSALWRMNPEVEPDRVGALLSLPQTFARPSLVVPIMVDRTPVGMFLLFNSAESIQQRESVQSIKLIADIIARRVELDQRQLCVQFHEDTAQFRRDIELALVNPDDLQNSFATLASAVRDHLSAEIVSLLVFHGDDLSAIRFTSSTGGNLVELKVAVPDDSRLTGYLYHVGRSVTITDIQGTSSLAIDGPMAGGTVRSILAVPIRSTTGCLGALILGGGQPGEYGTRHRELLSSIAPALAGFLQAARILKTEQANRQRLENSLRSLANLAAIRSEDAVPSAMESVVGLTGADCARAAILEDDGRYLRSVAFAGKRLSLQSAPDHGLLVLAVLDRHRDVLQSGQEFVGAHGDADRLTSRLELTQVVGEKCSSIRILPLVARGQLFGTITLGYAGDDIPHLSANDESVLQATIAQIALLIAAGQPSEPDGQRLQSLDRAVAANRSERDLRNRLRSPLTGILGSLEMLRSQKDEPNVDRYLAIMDKSARRMQKYLEPSDTMTGR